MIWVSCRFGKIINRGYSAVYKSIAGLSLFIVILLLLLPVSDCLAAPAKNKVLILYEEETRFDESFSLADALAEYLGHFNSDYLSQEYSVGSSSLQNASESKQSVTQISKISRQNYFPGDLSGYDVVFYIGSNKADLSPELLKEMKSVPKLVWVEQNIEQYVAANNWYDFVSRGIKYQFAAIEYKGLRLPYSVDLPVCCTYPGEGAIVAARLDNLNELVPYIWQKKNLWYIARLGFLGAPGLILADMLHDILGIDHSPKHEVLLRIEDVSPLTPPDKLSALADTAARYHVPYSVTVIPAFVTGTGLITLKDVPELVKVLRHVEETGGCIIQHGYTHSSDYSLPGEAEGFEFWNAVDDRPLPFDNVKYTNERVNNGLKIFASLGLYPVAFEPPHYAMSGKGYEALARHYSVLVGHVQLSDETRNPTLSAPFIFYSKRSGMVVYPENLGYFEPDQVDSVEKILDKAKNLMVVRDCLAGIFFHNYLPPKNLAKIIEGLNGLGYEFIDLRGMSYRVEGDDIKITSRQGIREISTGIAQVNQEESLARIIIKQWLMGLSFFLVLILSSFLLIIRSLRKNKDRLYETR